MAGIILMTNCNTAPPSITLLKKLLLKDYPSGSSVQFHDGRIYIIGDDANRILVLDKNYLPLDSITLFEGELSRIPKHKKADLESSAIVSSAEKAKLLLFGSAATPNRKMVVEVSLDDTSSVKTTNTAVFTERLKQAGIKEVNIEGAAIVRDVLVLANRANETVTVNHLIITYADFFNNQANAEFTLSEIELERQKNVIGISGLAYVEEEDILLFTASTEATPNAYDDGEIGDSYVGWIKNISTKRKLAKISADGIINLVTVDKEFSTEKIESICVEKYEDGLFDIHLVSDNDKGQTRLFKVKLRLH
jgi:hypothetical protein